MKRPCLGANGDPCGIPTDKPRCPAHEQQHQRLRNAARPGHRAAHRQARTALAPVVAAGVNCWRCGQRVTPPWDADQTPDGWRASHAACNRAAGGRGE